MSSQLVLLFSHCIILTHLSFSDGGLLCLHDFVREPGLGCCVRPSHWISGGTEPLDPHRQAHSVVGWWSQMLSTPHLDLMCFYSRRCLSHRLVLSTPFGVISYLLLWFVPRGWTSPTGSVLWFLAVACLFETLMSVSATATFTQW